MTTPPGEDNASFSGGGASRLLGTNQLTTAIDKLAGAFQSFSSKMGGSAGPAGSNATFSNTGSFSTPNGGGASFGTGVTLNGIAAPANGGWGSKIGGFAGGGLGGAVGGVVQGMAKAGGPLIPGPGSMNTMASISAYHQWAGGNTGMSQRYADNLAGFGPAGTNMLAYNASDAMNGAAMLYAGSGSYGRLNARGVNMFTMSSGFGITNPGMSATQQAQATMAMYNPQSSFAMMQMGLASPLKTGGGFNSPMQLFGQWNQHFGITAGKAGMTRLNYNLGTNGPLYAMLRDQYGASTANAIAGEWRQTNQLAGKGYNADRVFAGFNTNATTAQRNYSIKAMDATFGRNATQNITQLQKDTAGVQSQRAGNNEQAFQDGLAKSVDAINKFNRALNGLMDNSPLAPIFHGLSFLGGLKMPFGNLPFHLGGAAGGGAGPMGGSSGGGGSTSIVSGAAKSAVGAAEREIGVPYVWGGTGPNGFDCSGLTQWAYKQAGINIPRTSQQQWSALQKNSVPLNAVQAGDLVFAAGSDGTATSPGHVAMMVSSNQLIQAAHSGTRIAISPYNPGAWQHAARVSGSATGGGTGSGSGNGGTGTPGGTSRTSSGAMAFGGLTDASLSSISESAALMGGGLLGGVIGSQQTGGSSAGSPGTSNAGGSTAAAPGSAPAGSGGVPGNVQSYKGDVDSVLKMLGQPTSRDSIALKQMMTESGGQPTVVNKWDSNWKAGHPSVGLMQVIQGTFDAYAGPYRNTGPFSYGVSTDPMANIYAGLNYAVHRYGANGWTGVLGQGHGYARGTQNMRPGLSIVGENGPEAVVSTGGQKILTAGQTSGLLAQAATSPGGGAGVVISITLAPNSVVVNGPSASAAPGTPGIGATDVQSIGQAIADQIGTALQKHQMIQNLVSA